MENRIAELKHDLGADDFCLQEFFATEAAFRSILLLFIEHYEMSDYGCLHLS